MECEVTKLQAKTGSFEGRDLQTVVGTRHCRSKCRLNGAICDSLAHRGALLKQKYCSPLGVDAWRR